MKTEDIKRIFLYIISGILTTAINLTVFYLLKRIIPPTAANTAAWFASVIFAFAANRYWVFKKTEHILRVIFKEFICFAATRIFSGILDSAAVFYFIEIKHVNSLFVKISSNLFVIVFNYIASTFLFLK